MGKLKNNYLVIQSWMVRELGLKGNKLIVYAIIYGFSQTEKQLCTCGLEYMQAWTNSTKQGVLNTLDSLVNEGLIERVVNFGEDKRKVAYRIIGQESLPISDAQKGQQTLPKNVPIGQESLPKIGQQSCENRSTLFRASLDNINNNIYNFQTDKSVCQLTRACAREDETDGQTEKEYFLDLFHSRLQEAELEMEYKARFENIVTELLRRENYTINKAEITTAKILQAFVYLFSKPEKIPDLLYAGNKDGVKNKFLYTISALYNSANGF